MRRHIAAVVILASLLLAQVHVWTDFDPCLWNPAAAQQHRGSSGHNNHNCQTCLAGNFVTVTAVAGLSIALDSWWLETHQPHFVGQDLFVRTNAPRAPPA
ncbi:MAG: hypothetical protein HY046_03975 [Acidobacteria bacterium]|nr:hypothetical protein [Acidobacteriota bacterium]